MNGITSWHEVACRAKWSPAEMAQECGVSLRTLERHFARQVGKTPRAWLIEERMARAHELLTGGFSVKETAGELGYKSPQHFARLFKKHCSHCPCLHASLGKADAGERAGTSRSIRALNS